MATEAREMTIDQEMYERMGGSSALYERAKETFPSGVTHDARYAKPFPIYVNRAQGSRKWDVDGNEYVDYYGGHGALILGHCHPAVTEAVVKQAQTGTHYAAGHELEVRWASWCRRSSHPPRRSSSSRLAPRRRCWRSGWPAPSPAATASSR